MVLDDDKYSPISLIQSHGDHLELNFIFQPS